MTEDERAEIAAQLRQEAGALLAETGLFELLYAPRARDGSYGAVVSSFDIYRFAIAQAGNTLEELEAWKETR